MANPDLAPGALAKPLPGTARSDRQKRKLAWKREQEPEAHAETLERMEFWRLLRLELFARDGGCCRACGVALNLDAGLAANAFHAHHLIHRGRGGTDVIENLIALCATCHRKHHDGLLSITGTWRALTFVLKSVKGIIKRAWTSELAA